jgi:hypothetical protein
MSQGCCGEFDGLKNPARFRIVESHFSQRTREMGHPAQGGKSETSPTTDRCVSNDCLRLLHCAAIAAGSVRAFRTAISLAGHCVSLPIPLWISGAMAAHWSALSLLPPCCLCLRGFVKAIMPRFWASRFFARRILRGSFCRSDDSTRAERAANPSPSSKPQSVLLIEFPQLYFLRCSYDLGSHSEMGILELAGAEARLVRKA